VDTAEVWDGVRRMECDSGPGSANRASESVNRRPAGGRWPQARVRFEDRGAAHATMRTAAETAMTERHVTTLIADDEPLALRRLRALLAEIPWISLVGEVADGTDAVRAIDQLKPDLIFLDVVMPGLTGLEVLNHIEHRPTVVFTTAYDRFAVAAFEARALDYLLKPFGRRRLVATLDRIRDSLGSDDESPSVDRARLALDEAKPLDWLFVRERGRVTPVNIRNVVRFEGSDDYVLVHTADRRQLLVTLRMADLERILPQGFVRIHRSHVVNLAMVESFVSEPGGRFKVLLRDGTRLAVSRERARWLRGQAV
jgi:two-component system LytT family response regulator